MTDANSYMLDAAVVDVPEAAGRDPDLPGPPLGRAQPGAAQGGTSPRRRGTGAKPTREVGKPGRVLERFDRRQVAKVMVAAVEELREKHRPHPAPALVPASRIGVRWEGAIFSWHSLGHVNRELCLGLLDDARLDLSLVPWEAAQFGPDEDPRFERLASCIGRPLESAARIHVRHYFPPRFQRPLEGHLVLMQPWEYGYLPTAWIEPIKQHVSEVWCYSQYVQDVYLNSGIPEDRLQVVPLGVDAEILTPDAPTFVFTTEPGAERLRGRRSRPFVFAFVGGTLARKGIDVLLAAWRRAFTPLDDVLLLVKDTGTQTVYRGQNYAEQLRALAADPSSPPVVYLDRDLSLHQLAGIYTAADCLVMPYRGEGFLLPALEAMACGRPVVVPEGGPTDDFVDEAVGWRIPAERKLLTPSRVGEWDLAGPGWQFEVDPDDLARLLRRIVQDPDEAVRRGAAGRRRVVEGWTWAHAHRVLLPRIEALAAKPLPGPPACTASKPPTSPVKVRDRRRARANGTARRATISLCMIVKNEERVLGDCLASIKPWVDELIVVDTGSDDGTVAIAKAHGAKIHRFPWCDDFSAARNESLKHATQEWLLWMDADDVIPEHCGKRLREVALRADDQTLGLMMQVHCPPAPGEEGLTVVDHVKLVRNRPELRFEGRIHEQILEAIHRASGQVERTDLYVVHAGYDHSPEGQRRKRERDLKLLELDLRERPDHPFVLFNIGMTAFHMKDWPRAEAALQRCLQVSGPRESTLRKVYARLAGARLEQGEVAAAKQWVEQGLALYPHDPELLFRAGVILREAGELPAAEQAYLRLLTAREAGHIDSLDVTMTGFKAHHNLALVYRDMDRLDRAEAHFREAVRDRPNFAPSWHGLREILARQGVATS